MVVVVVVVVVGGGGRRMPSSAYCSLAAFRKTAMAHTPLSHAPLTLDLEKTGGQLAVEALVLREVQVHKPNRKGQESRGRGV